MRAEFAIADRSIGPGHPVYVIAELSANHRQDFSTAEALVRAAAEAGADAIKLQTYTPDTMTLDCRTEPFRIEHGTIWDGQVLYDLYAEAQTPWKWYAPLAELANELGLHCFSSAFDPSSVEFLESQDVPAYKVASFELVDLPLLRRIAATGRPMIVSTGMATLAEIEEAVHAIREAGDPPLALLRTNSAHPASAAESDLHSIAELGRVFETVVGLSDHSLDLAVPVAAVALGARIIEKHLTLSRDVPGPDSVFSLEPDEFGAMVDAVRTADQALGGVRFGPTERERASLPFRRSLFVVRDLEAGERFTHENVRSIRPAHGLHPRHLEQVLECRAAEKIARGTPLSWSLVSSDC